MVPTLAGFISYLRSPVNLSVIILPDSDWSINFSYCLAKDTVNPALCAISGNLYTNAVYNLATDIVLNVAQDQPGRDDLKRKREDFNINGFVPGVIGSSSNAGAAESLLNAEVYKGILPSQLQNLKTPWGRAYIAVAANSGSIFGMS